MGLIEKLGVFYLGRIWDAGKHKTTNQPLMYDAKDLVTHAVCVGMTGSGKTGLCITLLEEAAIDRLPAIIIDPKGDLGNLMLSFPALRPEDFRPWVDEDEAARQSLSVEEFAGEQAELWEKGIAAWGMDASRVKLFRDSVDLAIYTPGSNAGLPVSVLRSFAAPPNDLLQDEDFLRDRVATTVSGLLGLLGVDADPLQSKEHILMANILNQAWRAGEDLNLEALIERIQSPPFEKVGVFHLEQFFPTAERNKLAVRLNGLLAAPGFQSWLAGGPLDVGQLLYTPSGKPRLSIFSIGHLSDSERMFFVTLLLNEVLGWVRTQSGTSSLRALLYMDEIFGFFPPVSEPPSKRPLLTLLKQARAFGLGVVLSTQNPVDLDYKGLANAGTWFIGRLQTENDKNRLLDGLAGVSEAKVDLKKISGLIAGLDKRVFLLHNVHEEDLTIFQTRWALSYLRGPLTRNQIKVLMDPCRKEAEKGEAKAAVGPRPEPSASVGQAVGPVSTRPAPPPGLEQLFVPVRRQPSVAGRLLFHPAAAVWAEVSVVDNRLGLAESKHVGHRLELTDSLLGLLWDQAAELDLTPEEALRSPDREGSYLPVPQKFAARLKDISRDYEDFLARTFTWTIWRSALLKVGSEPGESERDFRIRLSQKARELRDEALAKLREKYAAKVSSLERQLLTAQQRREREQEQYKGQIAQTAISTGATILGAIFGRRAMSGTIGRATTAARSASRTFTQKQDIQRAEEQERLARERMAELEKELEREAEEMTQAFDPEKEKLQEIILRPKKGDINIRWSGLLWLPYWQVEGKGLEKAF